MSIMASKANKGGARPGALPDYDPLLDPNLRHYFSNAPVQKRLHQAGLIDGDGRILDPKVASLKTNLAQAHHKAADKEQIALAREEAELRRRVRELRLARLVDEQNSRKLSLFKEEERIRSEILRLLKESQSGSTNTSASTMQLPSGFISPSTVSLAQSRAAEIAAGSPGYDQLDTSSPGMMSTYDPSSSVLSSLVLGNDGDSPSPSRGRGGASQGGSRPRASPRGAPPQERSIHGVEVHALSASVPRAEADHDEFSSHPDESMPVGAEEGGSGSSSGMGAAFHIEGGMGSTIGMGVGIGSGLEAGSIEDAHAAMELLTSVGGEAGGPTPTTPRMYGQAQEGEEVPPIGIERQAEQPQADLQPAVPAPERSRDAVQPQHEAEGMPDVAPEAEPGPGPQEQPQMEGREVAPPVAAPAPVAVEEDAEAEARREKEERRARRRQSQIEGEQHAQAEAEAAVRAEADEAAAKAERRARRRASADGAGQAPAPPVQTLSVEEAEAQAKAERRARRKANQEAEAGGGVSAMTSPTSGGGGDGRDEERARTAERRARRAAAALAAQEPPQEQAPPAEDEEEERRRRRRERKEREAREASATASASGEGERDRSRPSSETREKRSKSKPRA